jgi:hypothetical protein
MTLLKMNPSLNFAKAMVTLGMILASAQFAHAQTQVEKVTILDEGQGSGIANGESTHSQRPLDEKNLNNRSIQEAFSVLEARALALQKLNLPNYAEMRTDYWRGFSTQAVSALMAEDEYLADNIGNSLKTIQDIEPDVENDLAVIKAYEDKEKRSRTQSSHREWDSKVLSLKHELRQKVIKTIGDSLQTLTCDSVVDSKCKFLEVEVAYSRCDSEICLNEMQSLFSKYARLVLSMANLDMRIPGILAVSNLEETYPHFNLELKAVEKNIATLKISRSEKMKND